MSDLIVEFKTRIHRDEDGEGLLSIQPPRFHSGHVVQGDRIDYTDSSLQVTQRLLGLHLRIELDHPLLTHMRGKCIGTFRVNLGTRKARRAALGAEFPSYFDMLNEGGIVLGGLAEYADWVDAQRVAILMGA